MNKEELIEKYPDIIGEIIEDVTNCNINSAIWAFIGPNKSDNEIEFSYEYLTLLKLAITNCSYDGLKDYNISNIRKDTLKELEKSKFVQLGKYNCPKRWFITDKGSRFLESLKEKYPNSYAFYTHINNRFYL